MRLVKRTRRYRRVRNCPTREIVYIVCSDSKPTHTFWPRANPYEFCPWDILTNGFFARFVLLYKLWLRGKLK